MIKSAGIGIGMPIVLISRMIKMAARPYCARKRSRLFMLLLPSVLSLCFVSSYGKRDLLDYFRVTEDFYFHISHLEEAIHTKLQARKMLDRGNIQGV